MGTNKVRYNLIKEVVDLKGRSEWRNIGNFESLDPHQYLLDLTQASGGCYSCEPYTEPRTEKPSIWNRWK